MPQVAAWEDDPQSASAVKPLSRPAPDLALNRLDVDVLGDEPPPRIYKPGSRGFRYWNAAAALVRAVTYWGGLVPLKVRWQTGRSLPVDLDAGVDLNAYYDRQALCFFHMRVASMTVYSGESPDVLCHELGHAVLDAIRPELWNAASIEVAAFHESFGDISAILSALQLPTVRAAVLEETGGTLSRSSRISRLAEQLGWAIRQSHPDAVDADCLRNAVNSFFYARPEELPPLAPATALASEPHSFSRVFTAAWLESVAGMLDVRGPSPGHLAVVADDAGRLLVQAIGRARIASNYYAQVAAALLDADRALTAGAYQDALRRAFVGRGILSMASAARLSARARPAGVAASPGPVALPLVAVPIDGRTYGLRARRLLVEAPLGPVPRTPAASAAPDLGSLAAAPPAVASQAFVEDLLRRGRVDTAGGRPPLRGRASRGRQTHALVRHGRDLRLVRRLIH